jgi:putative heme-binding domain-containing protein
LAIATTLGIIHASFLDSSIAGADDTTPAPTFDPEPVISLFEFLVAGDNAESDAARQCVAVLTEKIQTRQIAGAKLEALRPRLLETLSGILGAGDQHPLHFDAALLAATMKDAAGLVTVRDVFQSTEMTTERRLQALDAVIAAGDATILDAVAAVLASPEDNSPELRAATLASLGRLDGARVADVVLAAYDDLEAELRPRAIELLTDRPAWSKTLLAAIEDKQIPPDALNANQVRKLLATGDAELTEQVSKTWGTLRTERDPRREEVIDRMRDLVRNHPGDPHAGVAVFKRVCGQCHKIYGEGQEVGPDITANGRNSFEQLLSNVFDPSLVIGAAYQASTVQTADGRVLTGLLAENSPQRVVLKVQGGKQEIIARDDVDVMEISKLSLMPEDLEKQLTEAEIADLFAFLTLDRHPDNPDARRLPGVQEDGNSEVDETGG